jgi:hypothetical protein
MNNHEFTYPEGATPLDDISGLKPAWIKTQEDLNNIEAENISNATSKYLLKTVRPPQQWFNVLIKFMEHLLIFVTMSSIGAKEKAI